MKEEFRQKLINHYSDDNGYIAFDGFNCYELDDDWNDGIPCLGWDGEDRRCSCGNRRVSWVCSVSLETENIEDWYAEAY